MFLQLFHQTVCMNNDPTDTLSVSTTRLTAVSYAPAPTGQFTVSASPALSLHVLTPSHKSAAGPAKVQARTSLPEQIKDKAVLIFDAVIPSLRRPLLVSICFYNSSPLAGCLYEGRERANGETWDDVSDPCAVCVCHEGSVRCERKHCPPSNCNHPIRRQCCMSCDGE